MMISDGLGRGGGHRGGGGRHRGGRGWGWGGGWGGWWPGYDYSSVIYQAPENKYVLLDQTGKAVAVVVGPPSQVPPGYSFRPATVAEAATGVVGAGVSGLEGGSIF